VNRCSRTFDDALLSGYVDQALTQADSQRVRLHLEDCDTCRATVDDLTNIRETTMQTSFDVPPADQWSEAPSSRASGLSRGLGWTIVSAWLLGLAGFAAWQLFTSEEPFFAKLLIFGGWTGVSLLLLGVALDRLKAMKTDPYREVHR
jgi:anti-sigma factor RsiW